MCLLSFIFFFILNSLTPVKKNMNNHKELLELMPHQTTLIITKITQALNFHQYFVHRRPPTCKHPRDTVANKDK